MGYQGVGGRDLRRLGVARAHSHLMLHTTLGRSLFIPATPRLVAGVLLQGALGCIRGDCQSHYRFKKLLRLTGEKQIIRE